MLSYMSATIEHALCSGPFGLRKIDIVIELETLLQPSHITVTFRISNEDIPLRLSNIVLFNYFV